MGRARWWFAGLTIALLAGCGAARNARCTPGETRACALALEAGFAQNGTQTCGADGMFAACVGVGTCRDASGAALAAYARCGSEASCGPAGCATCNGYSGVENPSGFQVCYPYCATEADCAAGAPSVDVAPRCILGQCVLLCRGSSTCPRDSQCLPWLDPRTGEAYPGYTGLCD